MRCGVFDKDRGLKVMNLYLRQTIQSYEELAGKGAPPALRLLSIRSSFVKSAIVIDVGIIILLRSSG
jgi:hypothetical protein